MNTLEILTLLLVIFAALTYIDNKHNRKERKRLSSTAIEDSLVIRNFYAL